MVLQDLDLSLWLSAVPLCTCHLGVLHSPIHRHAGRSRLSAVGEKVAVNMGVQMAFQCMFLLSSYKYPEVGLLGLRGAPPCTPGGPSALLSRAAAPACAPANGWGRTVPCASPQGAKTPHSGLAGNSKTPPRIRRELERQTAEEAGGLGHQPRRKEQRAMLLGAPRQAASPGLGPTLHRFGTIEKQ